MAKKKSKTAKKLPTWKTQWPLSDDLLKWFRCMLKKCDAIEDPRDAASDSHLAIDAIAELGLTEEAIRHLRRYLRRLPKNDVMETVVLCELGAANQLDAGNFSEAGKFLARAESCEQHITRRCDIGFAIDSVRDFRALHGILDPKDAEDEKQRMEAEFNAALREFQTARAKGKKRDAKTAVANMETINQQIKSVEDWRYEATSLCSSAVLAN